MQAFTDSLRDRYVLERELGRGGMAVVYLATDVKHGRPVALKVMNPEAGMSLGPERFQREIRLAASLQHPHVLPVHDSGETAGRLWFTMPYVRGESLRDRLRRDGTLPIKEAIRITLEAAQALAHAHKHLIVHRDVKPENILLTEDGSTLVADFGIARTLDGPREQELTVTGVIVGTPKYMPPEQLTGGGDARIDQYALAEMCFEMLTGNPPFSTSGPHLSTMRRISDPTPSLRTMRPEVPAGVQHALERALAFDPESRFSSIAEFAKALEDGRTLTEPTVSRTGNRRYATWATGIIALGLIGVLGASVFSRRPASSAGASTAAAPVDAAVRRVVVLPFENKGDAGDAYFADGMADEVRGKLASVQGLEVIARASSSQYARTTKSPQRIGEELGVSYILTGTVRWDRGPGVASRVRVSPELVDAQSGVTRWHQSFDTTLTDVFGVQADIAGKVADALNVTVGDAARRQLAAKLTDNSEAYTRYLRGKELRAGDSAPDTVRTRDCGVPAGGHARSSLRRGLGRARARASRCVPRRRAAGLGREGGGAGRGGSRSPVAERPRHAPCIRQVPGHWPRQSIGCAWRVSGWPRRRTEQRRSIEGDGDRGVETRHAGRRRRQARADGAARPALRRRSVDSRHGVQSARTIRRCRQRARPRAVAPAVQRRYRLHPCEACRRARRPSGVREEVRALESSAGRRRAMAYLALRENILWALDDEQQQALLALTPADLDGGKADWALALAEVSWLRGDAAQARSYGEVAAAAYAQVLEGWEQAGEREQVMILRAYGLAYAGRVNEAIAEAGRALAFEQQLGLRNAYLPLIFARIYVLANRPEPAIDQLEETLRRRDFFSRGWLRIDGTFAPLRTNPRFQRLVASDPPS